MEKIDLSKEVIADTFTGRLVLQALTNVAPRCIEHFNLSRENGTYPMVDVEITFNGVAVPLASFVEIWQRSAEHMVHEAVKKAISDRLEDKLYEVTSLLDRIKDEVYATVKRELPEIKENDDD